VKVEVAVIGGGAAGIMAAISAGRRGAAVVILEKMPRLGKKLLISGNGRCNLLNERLDETHYNSACRGLVRSIFSKFGKEEIVNLFNDLGLEIYSDEDGRVFPATNQASSVLKALEMELKRLAIPVEFNFDVTEIADVKGGFAARSRSGKEMLCQKAVLTGGGKTYPALGSDGGAYKLAERSGHKIIGPVPSAVPLVVKDPLCHMLQGQRIFAGARAVIGGKPASGMSSGELLFTKYGLSGTAILDISEDVSIAMNRLGRKDAAVSVDLVPFMERDELKAALHKRRSKAAAAEELVAGILPDKFGMALKDLLNRNDDDIINTLKDRRFLVSGTRGWNEAEFTAGGVSASEVETASLGSRLRRGLYLAGEILDVQGKRGGYNLAWAWASGFVAGMTL